MWLEEAFFAVPLQLNSLLKGMGWEQNTKHGRNKNMFYVLEMDWA